MQKSVSLISTDAANCAQKSGALFCTVNRHVWISVMFDLVQIWQFQPGLSTDAVAGSRLAGYVPTKGRVEGISVAKWCAGPATFPGTDRDRLHCFHQFCKLGEIADGGDSRFGANESAGYGSECARKRLWRSRRKCGATSGGVC